MTDLAQALAALEATAQADLASAYDAATLEAVRVRWFGRKGSLATILRGLGEMDAAERPAAGKLANEVKRRLEVALEERQAALVALAQAAACIPAPRSCGASARSGRPWDFRSTAAGTSRATR
jgi:phenylalanyl-tRNA synthetase alpha subunit